MAGHSHAANVRHKKEREDAKRGKIFTKIGKLIMAAARNGADPAANPSLRLAMEKARSENMPKERIQRAILIGSGQLTDDKPQEDLSYEGYGPGGVAVLLEISTDNRNRTAGEIRKIFEIGGGSLGVSGCVGYLFEKKGLILAPKARTGEEAVMTAALDAGADDVSAQDEYFEILTAPGQLEAVAAKLKAASIPVEFAEVTALSSTQVELDAALQRRVLKMVESLEDHDDVMNVYHNAAISKAVLSQ